MPKFDYLHLSDFFVVVVVLSAVLGGGFVFFQLFLSHKDLLKKKRNIFFGTTRGIKGG